MTGGPDVLVLRRGVHGMPIEDYVAELEARLPGTEIRLARTPEEERERIADATIATGRTIDEDLLERAERLKLFACAWAGYGHLPLDALEAHGVGVTTASGVHGVNIAEYVVGRIVAFAHSFREGWDRQERREWRHYKIHGEVKGSTVAVVGLGAIGSTIVERLSGFEVETVGVRRSPEKGGPADEVLGPDDLHDALSRSEYVVLACPLTDETHGLMSTGEFETMDPEAVLINVARGPVVDTDALVDALRSEWLRGAALDVTDPEPLPEDHPLWTLDNVQITPHNSGYTPEYYARLADIVAENVRRIRETGEYEGLCNLVVLPDE